MVSRLVKDCRTSVNDQALSASWSMDSSQAPRDQFFHDLVAAGIDAVDPRIRIGTRDRELPHIAVAAMQLQTLVEDASLEFREPPLRHRGGLDVELALEMQ